MTTIPLVLLLATAAFGYRHVGIVDIKSLETSTKSDIENDISNEPNFGGNENQNGYIGNTEILAKSEGQLATGCFGVPEAVPEPTVNNNLDQITFPDSPPMSYPSIPVIDPIPQFNDRNMFIPPLSYPSKPLVDPMPQFNDRTTFIPPFPQMAPRPIHRYNQPFMPPSPIIQGMPFHHRPPPIVIVKMLQPIILPVVKVVPDLTTPIPDYEDIETNQLNNGRYRGRRMYNRMPFERLLRQPIIKTSDDTMRFSVKVY